MHARLFANQRALGPGDLLSHAQAISLDMPTFEQCLQSGKHAAQIRRDLTDGQKAGVSGTPAFFLGVTQSGDPKIKVLRVLKGAQPYSTFKEAIESLLSSPQ